MKLDKAANTYIKVTPALGLIFLIVVLTSYITPRANLPIGTDPSYWGAFGDYVGGILNPIFGIFTLLGLVITVWLQKEILETQKQELADTREELAKSAKALEIQNKTMLAQNFEGTFFQMLRRQSEFLDNLRFDINTTSPTRNSGLAAIDDLMHIITRNVAKGNEYLAAYEKIYSLDSSRVGPYFRNLYHVLKLIDENQHLTDAEKIKYASLARAQLTSSEISLIFYNCLTEHGYGLKPLIIKYRMLKHIDSTKLCDPNLVNDTALYPAETYLSRN